MQSPPDVSPPPPSPHDAAGVEQQLVGAAHHTGVDKLHPGHTSSIVVAVLVL